MIFPNVKMRRLLPKGNVPATKIDYYLTILIKEGEKASHKPRGNIL